MNDFFVLLLFVAAVLLVLAKNKASITKLTVKQVAGAGLSFLAVWAAAYAFIHYGGHGIKAYLPHGAAQIAARVVLVVSVLGISTAVLTMILRKLAPGLMR